MNDVLFYAFGHGFTALELTLTGVGLLLILAIVALIGSWRAGQQRAIEAARIA